MGHSRRNMRQLAESTFTPPSHISADQTIAWIVKADGNNLYSVELPSRKVILVELPSRFRSTIWLRRGGYVLVDRTAFEGRENKLDGEVVNVVGDEKEWRKRAYWPIEFPKRDVDVNDEDEDHAGRMPPSDEEDDDDDDG
ncbi:MAG: hypothetical protein M1816_005455 [Peltula sp. TS41687]|nr:MAG: hypothetical protein M1816_005455 [Peltula sp. TS41687]